MPKKYWRNMPETALIPGLLACPDAELVAIYGPTADKTAAIAKERSVARAYGAYERMLDEARPDAVVVATPNDVHLEHTLECAARGKHVFVEKPIADSVESPNSGFFALPLLSCSFWPLTKSTVSL